MFVRHAGARLGDALKPAEVLRASHNEPSRTGVGVDLRLGIGEQPRSVPDLGDYGSLSVLVERPAGIAADRVPDVQRLDATEPEIP